VPGDEEPFQPGFSHAGEDLQDRTAAADVAVAHRGARFDHIEHVEPQRLDNPLTFGVPEPIRDPDGVGRPIQTPQLRAPPPPGRLAHAPLVVPRRLASPRLAGRGVRGCLEQRRRAVGRVGRDRGCAVRNVAWRVQRERDLVDDAPDDGGREARAGLPVPPVVQDEPAGDAWLRADAAIGHRGSERTGAIRRVGRRDERAGCREAWSEVRSQGP